MRVLRLAVLGVLLSAVTACATVTKPITAPLRALESVGQSAPTRMHIRQRGLCDCAVASIAMMTGSLYEVVEMHVPPAYLEGTPQQGCGITTLEAVQIAASIGITLRFIDDDEVIAETVDPRKHEGALVLSYGNGQHHMVFIADGRVYDPLRQWPMKWDDYRLTERFRIGVFIYRVGRFTP